MFKIEIEGVSLSERKRKNVLKREIVCLRESEGERVCVREKQRKS